MHTKSIGLIAVMLLLGSVGCSQQATVTGVVTGNGKHVDNGQIVFRPIDGAGKVKPAAGTIQGDGTYQMRTAGNEPLSPGTYQVLYCPPDTLEDERGRAVKVSPWKSYKAPVDPITVEEGENYITIELSK
ncbi:hypothetical protein C5Y96_14915 [Blastopirellula marina]|uniref:Carboxypeptidase regulatory-like domain-containing protein n=1 Tax=Blastopirellula marina TaxID=124 RepID=A0A2S8FF27_9BACT|nr:MULTISPECIES: hypothetical protein [Pirellulaceae]PQO30747.1 hypothetical protein C5Y96_14915 [Blastopirellula marina]RCS50884.1 hypothetical protein DTL36_14925 [Bremerella cremea]